MTVAKAMEQVDKLTKRNSNAFFEAYMARKNKVLESFKIIIEKQGGPKKEQLDFSPESLVLLWTWLNPRLQSSKKHPRKSALPMWYSVELINNEHSQNIYFPKETVFYIDGLAYYFGDTLVNNLEGVDWAVCEDAKAFHYNKPVISGKCFTYPLNTMINSALGAIRKSPRNSNETLLEIFNILKYDTEIESNKT